VGGCLHMNEAGNPLLWPKVILPVVSEVYTKI